MLRAIVFAAIGAAVAAIAGFIRWMTTRWSVGEGTIHLRTGVLSEKVTDVPLGRVQAIDTVHGPLQRLFGVRGVQVQTAGGGRQSEITLPAVGPADVELLRSAVRRQGGPGAAGARAARRAPPRTPAAARRRAHGGTGRRAVPLLAVVPQLGDELWATTCGARARRACGSCPNPRRSGSSPASGCSCRLASSPPPAAVSASGLHDPRDDDRLRVRRGLLARREATIRSRACRPCGSWKGCCAAVRARHRPRRGRGYAKEAAAARRCSRSCGAPRWSRSSPRSSRARRRPRRPRARPAALRAPLRAPPAALLLALGAAGLVAFPRRAMAAARGVPGAAYGVRVGAPAGPAATRGASPCASAGSRGSTVLAPVARLQQHGVRQTVLQRHGRLADVRCAWAPAPRRPSGTLTRASPGACRRAPP